jgi:hypothetical protein
MPLLTGQWANMYWNQGAPWRKSNQWYRPRYSSRTAGRASLHLLARLEDDAYVPSTVDAITILITLVSFVSLD